MRNSGKDARKFFRSTIKKHRWYDYNFIYVILIKTLEYMEKNWCKSVSMDSDAVIKNIRLAKSYLIELRDDNFVNKYLDLIDEKYGPLEFVDSTLKRHIEPNHTIINEAYRKADADKTRVKRKLYLLLYKELENWWD